jgi:hypothetical protein
MSVDYAEVIIAWKPDSGNWTVVESGATAAADIFRDNVRNIARII